jgi:membrane protease YdiL (CAAX protease family)
MKTKVIQVLAALILPISFILILISINTLPLNSIALGTYDLGSILMTIIALIITYVASKKDEKSFKDIGLKFERKTPIRFVIGFLIGAFVTVLILAIVIAFSSVEIIYNNDASIPNVIFWLLVFFPLAFMEEIIFRGYAFMKINKNIGLWPAQILTALLFAWYHDFTGATFLNQLMGPGIWALIYGIAAVWSKGLALPTGLHMAINVVLALVGQKDERHAIWNLDYVTDITPLLQKQADNIGLLTQIIILVIGIILTENYRRKKAKNNYKKL